MTNSSVINVGVIGYGLSAKTFHIPFIVSSPQFCLTSISTSKKQQVAEQHPQVRHFSSAEQLIASKSVALVVITAPNDVHFELAKMCLLAGLHVIVEKPMTITSNEAEQLNQLAKTHNRILSVYHNRRWDGDFLTVKKLINQQALGQIKVFESQFNRCRPAVGKKWKDAAGAGTGVWYDLGAHLIDQAMVLFGLPKSLTAQCLALRENSPVIDYFKVQLHYDNHEVILSSSPFVAGSNTRFDIQGDKGRLVSFGVDVQEEQLNQGMKPTTQGYGQNEPMHLVSFKPVGNTTLIDTDKGCYAKFYQNIADAINLAKPLAVSAGDGVEVIKIIELAMRSSEQGKTISLEP